MKGYIYFLLHRYIHYCPPACESNTTQQFRPCMQINAHLTTGTIRMYQRLGAHIVRCSISTADSMSQSAQTNLFLRSDLTVLECICIHASQDAHAAYAYYIYAIYSIYISILYIYTAYSSGSRPSYHTYRQLATYHRSIAYIKALRCIYTYRACVRCLRPDASVNPAAGRSVRQVGTYVRKFTAQAIRVKVSGQRTRT